MEEITQILEQLDTRGVAEAHEYAPHNDHTAEFNKGPQDTESPDSGAEQFSPRNFPRFSSVGKSTKCESEEADSVYA